ncbi:hypothetical protein [Psychroflexus aestuariivivens]|uniref:hypothetical protein n=1 Tax=Psychroflexus aestuariivivens TaxID=1795040 RepID=UPI000FD7CE76|nr:hypothetical protein [Psychroflexus aestuariivivens]
MRYFKILIVLCIVFSCKSSKTGLPAMIDCPDGGECDVKVMKNSMLNLKSDSIGEIYPEVTEEEGWQVIEVTFSKKAPENTVDGQYSEIVYLQVPMSFKDIQSSNKSLQNQKVIFGKFCKCPEAGYEKVISGDLELVNSKGSILLNLTFDTEKEKELEKIQAELN